MTTLILDYLATNAGRIPELAATAMMGIPDCAWPAMLDAVECLGGCFPGIDCEVAFTPGGSFADFDTARANHWTERGIRIPTGPGGIGGLRAVAYSEVQIRWGEPLCNMTVIELPDGAGCVSLWSDAQTCPAHG